MKNEITKEDLSKTFEGEIRRAQKTIDEFAATLIKDPMYAFEWTNSAIRAAASLKVYKYLNEILKCDDVEISEIAARVNKEALRAARYPSFSTDPVSNYVNQQKGVIWAEIAENFEFANF
jgi:hypothetical protein